MSLEITCANIEFIETNCPLHRGYFKCAKYDMIKDQLPGCCFTAEPEKNYDRSTVYFLKCRTM